MCGSLQGVADAARPACANGLKIWTGVRGFVRGTEWTAVELGDYEPSGPVPAGTARAGCGRQHVGDVGDGRMPNMRWLIALVGGDRRLRCR